MIWMVLDIKWAYGGSFLRTSILLRRYWGMPKRWKKDTERFVKKPALTTEKSF